MTTIQGTAIVPMAYGLHKIIIGQTKYKRLRTVSFVCCVLSILIACKSHSIVDNCLVVEANDGYYLICKAKHPDYEYVLRRSVTMSLDDDMVIVDELGNDVGVEQVSGFVGSNSFRVNPQGCIQFESDSVWIEVGGLSIVKYSIGTRTASDRTDNNEDIWIKRSL